MKRWITILVVFLIPGAIVNVAVAWGCAAWSRLASMTQESNLPQQQALELLQERGFLPRAGDDYSASRIEGIGLTLRQLLFNPIRGHETSEINQRESAWEMTTLAGLPVRSLQAELRGAGLDFDELIASFRLIGGVKIDNRVMEQFSTRQNVLPLRPIWPGFVINTIFYAATLWLLTLGPFAARRMIRRKRGRCIKCGYDLRGAEHEVCPECGSGHS